MVSKQTLEKRIVELEKQIKRYQKKEQDRSSDILSVLLEAFRYIPNSKTFEDAAKAIFDHCKRLTGAQSGYVALLSENGNENEVFFLDAGGMPCSVDPRLPMPIRGLREVAYKTKDVTYDNCFADSPWMKYIPHGHVKLDNVLFSPLNIEHKTVGVIGLANKPGGFDEKDVFNARILGDLAAVALTYATSQDSLRQSELKYRSMMNAMMDAAYITSSEFRIAYMNPKMIDEVGRNALGERCHKAIYNNDEKCPWCVFDRIQQDEYVEYEFENPKNNHYYSVSNSPIVDADKTISKLTILHDITNRKSMEVQLQQVRKMESLGTIAGGIAHDFNNIIQMITGNAELALEALPEKTSIRENLNDIKSAGLRASGIVKQLLNFSHKADQNLKPIDAISVVRDALRLLRSTIPSSIEIRKYLPDTEITIVADPVLINQVLMNICTNASQEMEETGGKIEIFAETEFLKGGTFQKSLHIPSGKYLKIVISDTGPGIAPEIIDRIFDPYFTTKDVGQGSGMGLAVVHGIIKNHNGAITVASQLREGAIFTVYFPISKEKPVKEPKSFDNISHGDESIIFVDDEKSVASVGGKILTKLGYNVEIKTNPIEALKLFKSSPDQFDLIVTDMTMPQMSGTNLSKKIKEVRSDIPIIILTGHSSLIDEEKAKEIEIQGYAMKPISLKDLAVIVRNVLDEAK